MAEASKVLETAYIVREGIDYTEARVRVQGEDIRIRVGGFKASEAGHKFLIAEAEEQYFARRGMNGRNLGH